MLLRLLCFLGVVVTIPIGFTPLLATAAVAYLLRYGGVELILLAVLYDGYVGAFSSVPLLSIAAVVLVLIAEWLRPRLVLYTPS